MTELDFNDPKLAHLAGGPPFLPLSTGRTMVQVKTLTLKDGYKGKAYHSTVQVVESTQAGVEVGEKYTLRFVPFQTLAVRREIEMKKFRSFIAAVVGEDEKGQFDVNAAIGGLIKHGDLGDEFRISIRAVESSKKNDKGEAYINFSYELCQ